MKDTEEKFETFEVDGQTVENKPIVMVEVAWDGDTDNKGFGNWFILDERNRTGRYVFMSMYRNDEDAEAGYRRWIERQKELISKTIEMRKELIASGIPELFPTVLREFDECSEYSDDWNSIKTDDDFTEFLPKGHHLIHTDVKTLNSSFDHFYNPVYETGDNKENNTCQDTNTKSMLGKHSQMPILIQSTLKTFTAWMKKMLERFSRCLLIQTMKSLFSKRS